MKLNCCMCGKNVNEKLTKAVEEEQYRRQQEVELECLVPIAGVLCDLCEKQLRKDGLIH